MFDIYWCFQGEITFLSVLASTCCGSTKRNGKRSRQQSVCFFFRIKEFVSRMVLFYIRSSHFTIKYFIQFYSGFVPKQNIFNYVANRSKYTKKCKKKSFVDAVARMEDFIENPVVNIFYLIRKYNKLLKICHIYILLGIRFKWMYGSRT